MVMGVGLGLILAYSLCANDVTKEGKLCNVELTLFSLDI